VAEPFAGGLEAHVWGLADGLRRRGHAVTVFAGPGSDAGLGVELLDLRLPHLSAAARSDSSMAAPEWLDEHHAYLQLMMSLMRTGAGRFDVLHNHSLHHLPVAMAPAIPVPMVCTLHTPPTPWLESALQAGDGSADAVTFAAVSAHTARAWAHAAPAARVIPNGVDVRRWRLGAGGGPLVWSGRLTDEKGPHLAIRAARLAGRPLALAGPRSDAAYFDAEIAPWLDGERTRYVGHLSHERLAALVGSASAVLVTPRWDEPYGLVVAEALACGTPVLGFARGALPELVDERCGRLVAPDDVEALAAAIADDPHPSRRAARARAVGECSLERMVDRYVELYASVTGARARVGAGRVSLSDAA
jgi:glycosyltransferase involved in cell wall biosynthesis